MNKINYFNLFCGGVGGFLTYIFGEFDSMLKVLFVFIVLDYITGVLKAVYNEEISSKIGLKGIIRKVAMLIVVIASVALEKVFNIPLRTFVICGFIANEATSLLENASVIIPLPDRLTDALAEIKKDTLIKDKEVEKVTVKKEGEKK